MICSPKVIVDDVGTALLRKSLWGKAVIKHQAILQEKVKTLLAIIADLELQEDSKNCPNSAKQCGAEQQENRGGRRAARVELKEQQKNKLLKKAVRELHKDLLPRQQKHETQLELLGDRNS